MGEDRLPEKGRKVSMFWVAGVRGEPAHVASNPQGSEYPRFHLLVIGWREAYVGSLYD